VATVTGLAAAISAVPRAGVFPSMLVRLALPVVCNAAVEAPVGSAPEPDGVAVGFIRSAMQSSTAHVGVAPITETRARNCAKPATLATQTPVAPTDTPVTVAPVDGLFADTEYQTEPFWETSNTNVQLVFAETSTETVAQECVSITAA
jgi:hypothetical protein